MNIEKATLQGIVAEANLPQKIVDCTRAAAAFAAATNRDPDMASGPCFANCENSFCAFSVWASYDPKRRSFVSVTGSLAGQGNKYAACPE